MSMLQIQGKWSKLRSSLSNIRTVLMFSYLVIILICIAFVGAVSFYISSSSMSEKITESSFQIVRQMEKNMDNDFHNKRNLLLAPYYNSEFIDGINAYAYMNQSEQYLFRRKLGDLLSKSFYTTPIRDYVRFQIYYSTGELMESSDGSGITDPEAVLQEAWFRQTVAKNGRVHFSGLMQQAGSNAAYASSILIRDYSNSTAFIVVHVQYNAGLFDLMSKEDNLSANSQILIMNEHKELVYTSSDWAEDAFNHVLLGNLTGSSGTLWHGEGDRQMLVAYTRSDYSNWTSVLIRPKHEIIGPLNKIKTTTMFTALLAFVVTAIISILFGRRITKPILNLYKSVNRIKRGDFSVQVQVDRNDEIGRIAMNFNEMQSELRHLIESKFVYQIKLQQVELAMLYSQINPHFLYNTLDSIKAMAEYHGVRDIGEMAQSLADMFRYNIKSNDEIVTLQEELFQIDAYMNIQRIRFEDRLLYEVDIEEELYAFPLLKMTLQPIVENAVFHGIERKRGQGIIRISAKRREGCLELTVSDNGVGISSERLQFIQSSLKQPLYWEDETGTALTRGGMGIRNVYARYAIRWGNEFAFALDSRKGHGTQITLRFPSGDPEAMSEY